MVGDVPDDPAIVGVVIVGDEVVVDSLDEQLTCQVFRLRIRDWETLRWLLSTRAAPSQQHPVRIRFLM